MDGWFSIKRRLLGEPLWLAEPFTRGQAWVDLIGLANHEPGYIIVRGNKVEVKRGEVGWSEVSLADRWQWSRGRVRRFLSDLEKDERIAQQKSFVSSVITIINYDLYQPNGTADGTADGQQTDSRRYTNKKNKKEENNTPYSPPSGDGGNGELFPSVSKQQAMENFELARSIYPGKKRGLEAEFENFRKKNDKRGDPDHDWRLMLDDDGLAECVRELIDREQYSPGFWPHFQTFINQRRWEEANQPAEVRR